MSQWIEPDGRMVKRTFAVSKYGARGAKDSAAVARREAVERIM